MSLNPTASAAMLSAGAVAAAVQRMSAVSAWEHSGTAGGSVPSTAVAAMQLPAHLAKQLPAGAGAVHADGWKWKPGREEDLVA